MSRRIHWPNPIDGWFNFHLLYNEMIEKAPQQGAHFVELGVWKGQSTSHMCQEIYSSEKEIKFDAIDWFKGSEEHVTDKMPGSFSKDVLSLTRDEIGRWLYNETLLNLQPAIDLGLVKIIKMNLVDAASKYEDNSLDFVFHDASHEYEDLKVELPLWWAKVKPGGVFAGHDYSNWSFDCKVSKAVNEFAMNVDLDVLFRSKEDSWMIVKPNV